ncbi:MAG: anhydro-N-acetylmuramic acid kinase, partial [Alphaproteobacteria bacterium]|nr:anhydro-N-acetylmuramic acid kinase [Alphaproteobacteria bacterium]
GQTIWHQPEEGLTIQLGDGGYLARQTGIPVINDFRSADIRAGGQGAPLVPLYHRALAANLPKPVAIINIGGVSNITWIGGDDEDDILAFDMGPGNALIDDWMLRHTGQPYDKDGKLAALGFAEEARVDRFLQHPFFGKKPPKSLDRNAFNEFIPQGMSTTDGVATLTMMTVRAVVSGLDLLPRKPLTVYLTGGGRHNATMMRWIAEQSGSPVETVEALGWNGDSLEAETFAYLAVRSKLGLPLSLPGTTGVSRPATGGILHDAERRHPAIANWTGR